MTQESKKPDLYIYAKVADGDDSRIGPRIGVAFKHRGSEGINILLDAQPIPIEGQIQLVGFPPNKE